jgi:hypothetical protein
VEIPVFVHNDCKDISYIGHPYWVLKNGEEKGRGPTAPRRGTAKRLEENAPSRAQGARMLDAGLFKNFAVFV